MSFVASIHNIDKIKSDFDEVCDFLQKMLNEIGKKISIKQTKLHKYQEIINNIDDENLNIIEYYKTTQIVQRYNNIVLTIKNNIDLFNIDKSKFVEIIDGTSDINDLEDKSNHLLFEMEMAIRFFISSQKNNIPSKINISEDFGCDIIVDEILAIECKYIISEKKLKNNILKAIEQLEKRINNGYAQFGLVALDLSNIINIEKINDFSQITFDNFMEMNIKLNEKSFVSSNIDGNIVQNIFNNKNFKSIISGFVGSELEFCFYLNTPISIKDKINKNENIFGIIYQSKNLLLFKHNDVVEPINSRSLCYAINENFSESQYSRLEKLFHSLAIGV